MVLRITGIVFIYVFTTVAWIILGVTVDLRTSSQDGKLKSAVGQLWGNAQRQQAPVVYYQRIQPRSTTRVIDKKEITEIKNEIVHEYLTLDASDIEAELGLEYRRKGLLWYSVYKIMFASTYKVSNPTSSAQRIFFDFSFPSPEAVYDNFHLIVGDQERENIQVSGGTVSESFVLNAGEQKSVVVQYKSQGMDSWWYDFGRNVNQVKNFALSMKTDFGEVDFPENGISPVEKNQTAEGWLLTWKYDNLVTGVQIGIQMPTKLNPGPWVSRVTFFAPVSLFLFFFIFFILTTVKGIRVHPMNYFFIGCSFFAFHLLMAYLVDHIAVVPAFLICSAVSIFLVISYMRIVVGNRFAFLETGLTQFVYLVLFSYTFFFEGYSGLSITIMCIVTLFVIMQFTAKLDWARLFQKDQTGGG